MIIKGLITCPIGVAKETPMINGKDVTSVFNTSISSKEYRIMAKNLFQQNRET